MSNGTTNRGGSSAVVNRAVQRGKQQFARSQAIDEKMAKDMRNGGANGLHPELSKPSLYSVVASNEDRLGKKLDSQNIRDILDENKLSSVDQFTFQKQFEEFQAELQNRRLS